MEFSIRNSLLATLVVSFTLFWTVSVAAMDKPLLMEGKKTLYQRVLSVPEAHLYEQPEDAATSSRIIPFSVLYVYERNNDWLKVGYDSFGRTAGWVKRGKAIAWNQALTVSFKDPQDIQRVMMFSNKNELERLNEKRDSLVASLDEDTF